MATEKRLIDANALMKEMLDRRATYISAWPSTKDMPDGALGRYKENLVSSLMVSKAPTVDAIEVIRCHNCQHSEPCKARGQVWCPRMGRYMKVDAFCSEGVMKDG